MGHGGAGLGAVDRGLDWVHMHLGDPTTCRFSGAVGVKRGVRVCCRSWEGNECSPRELKGMKKLFLAS